MSREANSDGDAAYDVVVIGGGVSGLAAAASLVDNGVTNILVLEARERVGGRTVTIATDDGHWCDMGGAYVGPGQHRLLRLAHILGVRSETVHDSGRSVLNVRGRRLVYSGTVPSLPLLSTLGINHAIVTTEEQRRSISLTHPWDTDATVSVNGSERTLDSLTMEEWITEFVDTIDARELYRGVIRGICCVEPTEISALYWLFYVHSGDGFNSLIGTQGAAQERHFSGGMQQISERLRDRLGHDRVQCQRRVTLVHWSDPSAVTVQCDGDSTIYQCKRLIVALSPALYSTVQWSPAMAPTKLIGSSRSFMGSVIKTVTRYPRPFWRERGYSGMILNLEGAPIGFTYDDCHDDTGDDGQPFYALMGFCYGQQSQQWRETSSAERQRAICAQYRAAFECEEAMEPVDYYEYDWCADPLARGCYAAIMGPLVLTSMRQSLRSPMGPVHFAGTELAYHWAGYVDGAAESGERAAHEVLQSLGVISVNQQFIVDEPGNPQWECQPSEHDLGPSWMERQLPRPKSLKWAMMAVTAVTTVIGVAVYLRRRSRLSRR